MSDVVETNEESTQEAPPQAERQRSGLYRRNRSSVLKLRQLSGITIRSEDGADAPSADSGSTRASPLPEALAPLNQPPRSPTGTVRRRNSSFIPRKKPSVVPSAPAATAEPVAAETKEPEVKERPPWHTMSNDEFLEKAGSRVGGLTSVEAYAKLKAIGKNELTPPEMTPVWLRFLQNMVSPFSLMLQGAGVLCFIIFGINTGMGTLDIQTLTLAIVLFAVAIITTIFQTSQEASADNLVAALHELAADAAWVYRDGKLQQMDSRDLVPGDHIRVLSGEKVPADVRIIEAADLKVNNAPLTGENADIKLGVLAGHHDIFEAKNVAWSGCNFTSGTGVAVVFDTGDRTYFGDIAKATTTAVKPDTLMRREVRRLIIIMAVLGCIIAIAFFITSLSLKQTWQQAVIIMIGLFVANIPEGLLPQITIALTITARRMQDKRVIVSNLEIIETLGAVSVICSDKTGTLTTNRMTVSHVVYNGVIHIAPWSAVLPSDNFPLLNNSDKTLRELMKICALCSDATFISRDGPNENTWIIKGDATESGLMRFVQPVLDIEETRKEYPRLGYVPFHSQRKWMASVNAVKHLPNLFFKGAAERVLARCISVIIDDEGTEVPLTEKMLEDYQDLIEELAGRGERVIGFARLPLRLPEDFEFVADGEDSNFPLNDLVLIGFVSLADPPRPSVKPAVAACHKAGIRVIMVTGDHPETAKAISRSLGIITAPLLSEAEPGVDPSECAAIVTGEDILTMSEADWTRVLSCKEQIFARTQPEQKQALVYHLQRLGHIVGMTGDGVNDAPALKAANVGVAMGSGTSVAKEAAQIVICDDDFGSIVVAIQEGRQIFENLKKAVTYILSHLSPEVYPYIFAFALGIPLAMETIVILLVDLGTDMLPGIALAFEEAEERLMSLPPRSKDSHLISPSMIVMGYGIYGLIETFFAYWGFFWTFSDLGFPVSSLFGLPSSYRQSYADLSSEDRGKFSDLCRSNTQYVATHGGSSNQVCGTTQGMSNFMSDFSDYVSQAQAAYFVVFACMQFANILTRRQQTMSAFSPSQVLNWRLFASIIFSVGFMCFFIYVPSVNTAFYLSAVSSSNACAGLWGLPVLIFIDELRKMACRQWPEGIVARLTVY